MSGVTYGGSCSLVVCMYSFTIDDKGPPDEDMPHDPEGKGTLYSCGGGS